MAQLWACCWAICSGDMTTHRPLLNSRLKTALAITDVRPTTRPEILEVILESTGKPMRLRRDMVEFYPGRVVIPLWLSLKANLV